MHTPTTGMNKSYLPLFSFVLFLAVVFAFTSNESGKIWQKNVFDTLTPQIVKAKDHLGKSVISNSGIISFTTGLENDFYQVDSPNKLIHFYVEAKLSKFLNNSTGRIPLNISIVIDKSSSMQGVKMGYAKRAAKNIIDQLMAQDIISIVVYDSNVDTIQSPTNVIDKEKIKSKIDIISPQASTNLWGGTEQGYQFVKRNYKAGYVNRVLLISDGLANVGLTDSILIRLKVQKYKNDEGISISTFGVGLDYNETLMTDMAETGAGNYYFIDAPNKMTAIFNNELKSLLSVAAQNAELKIRLPKGVTIQKCYPLNYQQNDDQIIVRLRDLSFNETKAAVFTFKIDEKTNNVLTFTSQLSYTDATDGQQKLITARNLLSPVENSDAYLTHFNRQVIEQTILYTANEKLEAAMNLMGMGNYTEAKKYLRSNGDYLRANSVYVGNNKALMRLDSINTNYSIQYLQAEAISKDSVKKIQKANKAINYQIRNKKQ